VKHYPSNRGTVRIEGMEVSHVRSQRWRWFWQAVALQILSFIAGCAIGQHLLK